MQVKVTHDMANQQQQSSTTAATAGSSSGAESRVPMTLRESFFTDDFFRNSWEDFERLRRDMMETSQSFWKRAEQEMKMLDQCSSSSSSAMQSSSSSSMMKSSSDSKQESSSSSSGNRELMRADSMMAPGWIFPRRWMMMPKMFGFDDLGFGDDFFNDKMKNLNLFQDKDEQVIRMKDDEGKFELSLDTHGFRPDEIKVNVAGRVLGVEAKHEEKSDSNFVSRQFSRRYTLPEGCEAARVNSNLSSDGILVITAPKRQAVKHQQEQTRIPVEVKKN